MFKSFVAYVGIGSLIIKAQAADFCSTYLFVGVEAQIIKPFKASKQVEMESISNLGLEPDQLGL